MNKFPSRCLWSTTASASIVALSLACAPIWAQTSASPSAAWPNKPITIVVPYPAGTGFDSIIRPVAAAMQKKLGQKVNVDFRPGANGSIATGAVIRSEPDGNTVIMQSLGPVVLNKLLYKQLPYDPQKDLVPVAKIGEFPLVLIVNSQVPANNLQELVAYAKANPGKLNQSNTGIGSQAHLTALLLERVAGITLNIVPYGTSSRLTDLLSGRTDLVTETPTQYLPHIASGKLRALAVLGPKRADFLPNVPTSAEAGFPGVESEGWAALFGPRGIPEERLHLLNQVVNDYLKSDEAREHLARLGLVPSPMTPGQLGDLVTREFSIWTPLIKERNISLQ